MLAIARVLVWLTGIWAMSWLMYNAGSLTQSTTHGIVAALLVTCLAVWVATDVLRPLWLRGALTLISAVPLAGLPIALVGIEVARRRDPEMEPARPRF